MLHSTINLLDVRAFVLVANLGNFTKAAEALNVSRSHVSRQIQALEKEMGVSLMIRTTRTMKLTQAGKALLTSCDTALNTIDQAVHAAVDDNDTVKGKISINCVGGYIGEELVANFLAKFSQRHPDVSIDLDFSSHRVDLLEDEFDLAIRMGVLPDANYIARHLIDIEMLTLASPIYLQSAAPIEHPKDLKVHNCLTGSVTKWQFIHATSNETVETTINGDLTCKNGRVLVNSAKAGLGIIRVPAMYCEPELAAKTLVPVFGLWGIKPVPLSLIYHRDRYQPKRIKECVSFLKAAFEQ
ncbi:LysR family transcriptional regulator [Vibrio sp. 10N.286.49.C2]|uniref:LysR family transcriptional regulator n=1 Tax=unclassified Vibrio TaxID=2614977 RepID=UPI000C84209F|nr:MULTISPECIES: LysR family transcriptional regulator [unclassified Vibrio]PMH43309.1 LysR family transcriptional regulator [Vibrio sp. 10N.286.49.C2]PMH56961.1 LysR family transcriptional regulator [Vibrio sp. 10N.286.49.B1]PMH81508.1 LysR family transcriptional regulator [Vibrio sp. 10N.286.48.B7]